ncbi:hypothetical protein OKW34_006840 [Paraburkholderia youngii]|uniref:hypothetical protein n=1 Tax=Paraburkholderia youngii TaxID=2782701 RepID=UPI003D205710
MKLNHTRDGGGEPPLDQQYAKLSQSGADLCRQEGMLRYRRARCLYQTPQISRIVPSALQQDYADAALLPSMVRRHPDAPQ